VDGRREETEQVRLISQWSKEEAEFRQRPGVLATCSLLLSHTHAHEHKVVAHRSQFLSRIWF